MTHIWEPPSHHWKKQEALLSCGLHIFYANKCTFFPLFVLLLLICFSGGAKGLQDSSKEVLTMDSTYEWTKFGEQLKQSRREHITLVKGTNSWSIVKYLIDRFIDNKLIHIGGREERYVEVWIKQSDGYFTQKLSDFQLTWWANFPNAFIIDETDYEEPE